MTMTWGGHLIEELDGLFNLAKVLMNLPGDIKQKYRNDPPRSFLGPKAAAKRRPWGQTALNGSTSAKIGLTGCGLFQPLPEPMNDNLPLLKSFLEHGQDILQMVCCTLATQLGLPLDSFISLQPPSKPSGTAIRFIKVYACPLEEDSRTSMVHHTDIGSSAGIAWQS
ncbi:hypothetical protein GGR52DRAFT_481156 [Hypoxylon sp. FL1284]|nr:hypothetical protein GGR52DRAFT_481156 [Hypoxylon sp. FL1284]